MIRFHVVCAEMSDELEERVNQWLHRMQTIAAEGQRAYSREMSKAKDPHEYAAAHAGTVPYFKLLKWQVSHNGDLTYWTGEYQAGVV